MEKKLKACLAGALGLHGGILVVLIDVTRMILGQIDTVPLARLGIEQAVPPDVATVARARERIVNRLAQAQEQDRILPGMAVHVTLQNEDINLELTGKPKPSSWFSLS